MKKKVGVINSGGDAPGLNAVIASLVKADRNDEYEFYGFIKGWEGLLDKDFIVLTKEAVRGLSHTGGTFLKTVNKGRFAGKVGSGDHNKIPDKIIDLAISNLTDLGIESIVVIGGDGTQAAAVQLIEKGVNVVGVPKTVDNDLDGVAQTFGFATAVDTAAEAMHKLHATATSHERVFIVEVMGRNAGWIALLSGIAGGADAIILPEFSFDSTELASFIQNRREKGQLQTIVVVAEGIDFGKQKESLASEIKHEGAAKAVAMLLSNINKDLDIRTTVLGHIQRGGNPNSTDIILSKSFGVGAFTLTKDHAWGKLVTIVEGALCPVEVRDIIGDIKRVKKDTFEYTVAKDLGIYIN